MIVSFRVMPEDGETDYSVLEAKVKETVETYDESVKIKSISEEGVGFGLKAVAIEFQIDEVHGSEDLENKLAAIPEAGEVNLTKMDRL
jgi:translation elongation factor aEF-1 beta